MRTGDLKGDIINKAYSQGRISGLTSIPGPEEIAAALDRLENMAEEFRGRNICTGYNFEDEPDPGSEHGLDRKYWFAFQTNLAGRLLHDFGKIPNAGLTANIKASYSFLASSTAQVNPTQYPGRQPIGSGNSLWGNRFTKFYHPTPEAPVSCATKTMKVGAVDDFVEHFDSYLIDPEEVSSHTIEADTGLTIVSDSLSTPDISYRINAEGNNGTKSDSFLQLKIVATTSTGRIEIRLINFELIEADL